MTTLTGLMLYLENHILTNASVAIENGKIASITEHAERERPRYRCLPGRIDLHIHGACGVDVMDATPQALNTLCRYLPQEGTTGYLATTMSMPETSILAALCNIANYTHTFGARILGAHLEGPFIAPQKAGAHSLDHIRLPDTTLFDAWQTYAKGLIRLVTVAPELEGALDFISHLTQQNVIASLGHTHASYAEAIAGIDHGCRHATHLHNAMTGLDHRQPGAALAILERNTVLAELIADGIHVSPDILRFAYHVKGREQLCLVTDSMRAKCMGEGTFELGQQVVTVQNGHARLADGTLAGSVLSMDDACHNMLSFKACDLMDLTYLCSINPAKQLGIFSETGSIAVGKDADLIILDEQNRLCATYCKGVLCYQTIRSAEC